MSSYLFQNGSVYVFRDGPTECVSWDEFRASSMVQDRDAHILIAEADGPFFMDHVRQIRQAFSGGGIKTCVPYALALRAFLQMRGLVATGESCLVADDLGDKFLLTASNGRQMAVTRAILDTSPARIVEEIRRTQKSVMEKDSPLSREPVFRILSNNRDVIAALDPERKKEARFFETVFPAFEVLGKVKFPFQLMAPEELVMQKQGAIRRGLIVAWIVAVFLAGLGTACFMCAQARDNMMTSKMTALMRDKTGLTREVHGLAVATYQDRLKSLPRVIFMDVVDRFLTCLPPEGQIEHVSFERGMDRHWGFSALVSFPQQEIFPFVCDGIFKEAKVEHIFIQARPGIRVRVTWTDQRKEGSSP